MAEKKDNQPVGAEVAASQHQIIEVLLRLFNEVQRRANSFTVDDLPEDVKRDIASVAAEFARIDGGLKLAAPPTLTGLTPAAGPSAGSTGVRIRGTNFEPSQPVTVVFAGKAAQNVKVLSPTEIEATTPANAPGAVEVEVITAGGTGRLPGGFTYQ